MSNVYILEPPTTGKVLLKTTVGDIDIELWAKETPKTCRNFIQLCLEGYYNGTIFHRVVKGFIAQGGDPRGDGTGGESIYGETFKDEFHQRLRFARRGLVAMANAGKDDNASQFFFTLAATPELQNKHTIFGKVTGETVFNMLKLEEGLIEGETPVYPHKIIKADVLNNPFPDIEPRIIETTTKEKKKKKDRTPGVKNFKLLSFGEEAEEDEEETCRVNEKFVGKGKSTHDVLDDPKLSSATIETASTEQSESKTEKDDDEDDDEEDDEAAAAERAQRLENIKNKLKGVKNRKPAKKVQIVNTIDDWDEDKVDEKKRKYDEIKKEIETVKRDYHKNKLKRVEEQAEEEKQEEMRKGDNFKEYKDTYQKYKNKKKELPKKGAGREQFTLSLLSKFKEKLNSAKENKDETSEDGNEDKDDIDKEENWLSHELHFVDENPVLAKDANTKDDDWFEIYDPRNPLNKRRRGENTASKSKK